MGYVSAVEAKGWCLYDVSGDLQDETWEQRARREAAREVQAGSMYLFVPQSQDGQTLREAYAVTKGVGPCLRINNPSSSEYRGLALCMSPRMAFFSRLVVEKAGVMLFTPKIEGVDNTDMVILEGTTAEATFARDFDVISPEQFRRELNYRVAEWG
jgi:hypothetical protein